MIHVMSSDFFHKIDFLEFRRAVSNMTWSMHAVKKRESPPQQNNELTKKTQR